MNLLRPVFLTLPLAFVLWFFTFALPLGNFWFKLAISASILAVLGLRQSRNHRKTLFHFKTRYLWLGPLSAILLYGIFWLGKEMSAILFPFAPQEISTVYFNKAQLNLTAIGLLLFF